jgi:hypothetical protein
VIEVTLHLSILQLIILPEGVQQLLESKREEASWMGYVDTAEVRGKKEKTILVVAKNRIFFLKPGGKV